MKTKLLIIFLALAPVLLQAQTYYSSVLWDASMDSQGEIVRSWGSDHVLTYHIGPSGNYFTLTHVSRFHMPTTLAGPSASTRQTATLPADMWVTDVRILGDEAFFCGAEGPHAVVGKIDLNDFATGTVNIEYIEVLTSATRYKKLVAYNYSPAIRIVACIGEDAGSGYDDVVSVFSYFSGVFSLVRGYKLPREEDMDDIHYTGDDVVIVGRYNNSTTHNQLIVRRFPSIALPTTLTDRTLYPAASYEVNGLTSSVYMRGYSTTPVIAVSYVHYDSPSNQLSTRVRYIDLQTMAMLRSHEFPREEKEEVLAMLYSKWDGRLAVVFSEPEPGTASNVTKTVLLQPDMPSPYPGVRFYFPSPFNFYSADIINDLSSKDINLVEAGHGRWYLQHIPTAGPGTAVCPASDIINVDIIPDLPPVPIPYSTIPDSPMFGPTTWPMTLSPVPVSTTCYSTR